MSLYHYIAISLFAAFAIGEWLFRARRFPEVRLWKMMGLVSAILYFAVGTFAPLFWDPILGQHQLIDASALPFVLQIVAGYLVLSFLGYWWHRTMHAVTPVWRLVHQMHHSAERVDVWGAFYFHPLDMAGWALQASVSLVLVIGLSPEATLTVAALSTALAMFQHLNVPTPRWLGWFVMRPEQHSVHHQRGLHAGNYGDIALWDMLFGTFSNPAVWRGEAGFHDGSTMRIVPLLAGKAIA
jgi:sterol desaturase/sphingolipid hydroxylase (fatty acid hydroxylase superfamily)